MTVIISKSIASPASPTGTLNFWIVNQVKAQNNTVNLAGYVSLQGNVGHGPIRGNISVIVPLDQTSTDLMLGNYLLTLPQFIGGTFLIV
jgi:hypothetical protein